LVALVRRALAFRRTQRVQVAAPWGRVSIALDKASPPSAR
jgi:hypothetical protein